MSAAEIPGNLLRLALLLAGLLLPGSMILRALRLPWSLAGAFACSALSIYMLVLALSLAGTPITLASLSVGLALLSLLPGLLPARRSAIAVSPWHACFTKLRGWTPLYALFWLVVGWRLATQPLSGPDVAFRWSWLAEQIVQTGSLDFYPPRSSADFLHYFWPESIPPGVAGLYTWSYACGGGTHALWTSPVVALQLLSVHELVWRLGNRWGGEVVARRAVVLLAATPLLTWSVLIGQESGLVALAVGGIAWSLAHVRDEDGPHWAALAGLFAALGATAREYGPAFAVATVAWTALSSRSRAAVLAAAATLPIALAWLVRAWWLTGNPFHSLDLAGMFPINRVFLAWSAAFHAPHASPLATSADWLGLARHLVLWALPAVLGLVVLFVLLLRGQRDARAPAMLVALVVALWALSLPYTAGGLFYSLRVLSPALLLLPVFMAYGCSIWVAPVVSHLITIAISIVCLESLPKTLVLPQNPYRTAVAAWADAGHQFPDAVRASERALSDTFRALPPTKRIISDNAGIPRLLASLGVEVIPLWSPDVGWLFDASIPPEEVARRWQQSGFRYLIVSKASYGAEFVMKRAQWRAPYFSVRSAAESGDNVVLEVTATPPESAR